MEKKGAGPFAKIVILQPMVDEIVIFFVQKKLDNVSFFYIKGRNFLN